MSGEPATPLTDQHVSKISDTTLLAVSWTLVGITCLCFVVRLFIRLSIFRRLFTDDGFAVLALAILIANAIVTTIMAPPMYELILVSVGLAPVTPAFLERASLYLKLQFASTLLFWSCLWAVKGCFLAFFYRLTESLDAHRRVWWVVTIITSLAYLGSVITYPVSCTSFELGECQAPLNVERSLISLRFSTAVDIITDAMIIAIPLHVLYHVRISLKQKMGLFLALCLGVVIIIFSVVRIIVTNTDGVHPEVSWLALWSVIESSVAVIVACLTSFKALLVDRQRAQSNDPSGSGRRYYHRYGAGKDVRAGESRSRSRGNRRDNFEMPEFPTNIESPSSVADSPGKGIHVVTEELVDPRRASSESQAQILAWPLKPQNG